MTLPSSGAISYEDINIELGRSATASLSLDDADLLSLINKNIGDIITLPTDFHGKSFITAYSKTFTAAGTAPLIGMTSGDLLGNGPTVEVNGNEYEVNAFYQNTTTKDLVISLAHGANPSLQDIGVELTLTIDGKTITTHEVTEGGSASVTTWIIPSGAVFGFDIVNGNSYTLGIAQSTYHSLYFGTVTAGAFLSNIGYETGLYGSKVGGDISINGADYVVQRVYTNATDFVFAVQGTNAHTTLNINSISRVIIDGQTYDVSDATINDTFTDVFIWTWTKKSTLVDTNVYDITVLDEVTVSSESGTMTAGEFFGTIGFDTVAMIGSVDNNTITLGANTYTLVSLKDDGAGILVLSLSGATADTNLNRDSIVSLELDGETYSSNDVTAFQQPTDIAEWHWTKKNTLVNSGSYSYSINHH